MGANQSQLVQKLDALEHRAMRGELAAALSDLRAVHDEITGSDGAVQVAVAERAVTLSSMGAERDEARAICDRALERANAAADRGGIQLCRGHTLRGIDRRRAYSAALAEFTNAHDARGMALALGWLAQPTEDDDDLSHEYRARLARDAVRLAEQSGDSYAIALTTGHLAACETLLGLPTALAGWRRAAASVPAGTDTLTAHVVGLNYVNWALTATGLGAYQEAHRALAEGEWVARGEQWARMFKALASIVDYRCGDLATAVERAGSAMADGECDQPDRATAIGIVVRAAGTTETARQPDTTGIGPAVERLTIESEQIAAFARRVQSRVRRLHREPQADRGLADALELALRRGRRFGWEDLAVALCETNLPLGRRTLSELPDERWPTGPRAEAARRYVDGLIGGRAGHRALIESAEAFAALPEPLSAGRAFHLAAQTAPDAATGNRLRERAVELLQGCGADRSLASVLRDRRLRRTATSPRIPKSQRHSPSTGFTRREHQVAALAQRGLTATEIAAELSISPGTARNHLFRIREKLGGVPKRRLVEMFGPDAGE
jgi:DNA-binding CsgD family transcriptional regulator